MIDWDTFISPAEVAERRNSSPDTVVKAIKDGELDAAAVFGTDGKVVTFAVKRADAEQWMPYLMRRRRFAAESRG